MRSIAETGNETGPVPQRDLFGRIRRFDPRTLETDTFVEGGLQTLINPDKITVDRAGNLFVCEDKLDPMLLLAGDNNVVLVTPEGATSVLATLRGGREPSGVVFSPVYAALFLNVLEAEGAVLAITGF
jgi:secreted PhoX family phosphatase